MDSLKGTEKGRTKATEGSHSLRIGISRLFPWKEEIIPWTRMRLVTQYRQEPERTN